MFIALVAVADGRLLSSMPVHGEGLGFDWAPHRSRIQEPLLTVDGRVFSAGFECATGCFSVSLVPCVPLNVVGLWARLAAQVAVAPWAALPPQRSAIALLVHRLCSLCTELRADPRASGRPFGSSIIDCPGPRVVR